MPSLVLGTGDVTLLSLTTAYAVFANGGLLQRPMMIRRVEDAAGKVLLETTILNGSMRPSATVTLDARKQKSPWKLYVNGGRLGLFWDGPADSLVIAPTPSEAQTGPPPKK